MILPISNRAINWKMLLVCNLYANTSIYYIGAFCSNGIWTLVWFYGIFNIFNVVIFAPACDVIVVGSVCLDIFGEFGIIESRFNIFVSCFEHIHKFCFVKFKEWQCICHSVIWK